MDLYTYLFFRREAYIYELSKTEAGLEYLRNCWRISQTKPERAALREQFGEKGVKRSGG